MDRGRNETSVAQFLNSPAFEMFICDLGYSIGAAGQAV
jgi:hypothetical protein